MEVIIKLMPKLKGKRRVQRCQKVTFAGNDWWNLIRFVCFSFSNSLVAAAKY